MALIPNFLLFGFVFVFIEVLQLACPRAEGSVVARG